MKKNMLINYEILLHKATTRRKSSVKFVILSFCLLFVTFSCAKENDNDKQTNEAEENCLDGTQKIQTLTAKGCEIKFSSCVTCYAPVRSALSKDTVCSTVCRPKTEKNKTHIIKWAITSNATSLCTLGTGWRCTDALNR